MSNLAVKKGLTQTAHYTSTASTNAVVLVSGPSIVVGLSVVTGASARWLRIYDLNREPLPSDDPIHITRTNASLPLNSVIPDLFCENGIAIRITANGAPPTAYYDDTAITAGDVFLDLFYKRVA